MLSTHESHKERLLLLLYGIPLTAFVADAFIYFLRTPLSCILILVFMDQ